MSKTFNTRVKWKRDTSANWTANNPILLDGEIIIIDTNAGETRFKIGNGISTYTQLPFQDEYIQNSITNINNNLTSHEQNYNNPHQVNKEDIGLSNVDNVKQYSISNPPPYPVTSVNGKIGAVIVPSITVPTTTSLIKGDGAGGVSKAVANTDYATCTNLLNGSAEGSLRTLNSLVNAPYAIAEGTTTLASGHSSHAEGSGTIAKGHSSHAEGASTAADGDASHAEGADTIANHKSQHVQGEYNIEDDSTAAATKRGNYAHIVGNGAGDSARSNAHTLDWSGNAWFAGDVYVGSTSGMNKDAGSKKLITIDEVPDAPVTSVNSKTGAVQLNAIDVGALPNTTIIPSKTSQLNNDSGFISKIPIATSTKVGGVKPVAKTSAMTQNVGISSDGLLYTNPSNRFLVTLTTPYYTGGHHSSNDITADKRFTEISAAYQNGETVQAIWGGWILDLVTITNDYADFAMCTGLYNVNTALSTITAVCETNNGVDTWNIGSYHNDIPEASTTAPKAPGIAAVGTAFEYARADHVHPRELPSVKSSDNGKFLRVVDSAWVAASVPDANGGIF